MVFIVHQLMCQRGLVCREIFAANAPAHEWLSKFPLQLLLLLVQGTFFSLVEVRMGCLLLFLSARIVLRLFMVAVQLHSERFSSLLLPPRVVLGLASFVRSLINLLSQVDASLKLIEDVEVYLELCEAGVLGVKVSVECAE